jgi:hypothetical protein
MTAGRYADHMRWTVGINKRLNRDHRVFQDRTHIFTAFQDHVVTVYRTATTAPVTSTPWTTPTPGSSSRSSTPTPPAGAGTCSRGYATTTFPSNWPAPRPPW